MGRTISNEKNPRTIRIILHILSESAIRGGSGEGDSLRTCRMAFEPLPVPY